MAWLSIDFDSKALGMPASIEVLMPQGRGEYKIIYLLHGAGGDKTAWLLKTKISDYVEKKNIAVVMPSGNNSFYINSPNGKKYMDYISEELPQLCKQYFSISNNREDAMIAGMSMGGYGAFVNGMNKPENFGAIASFSGVLDILERYDNPQGLPMERIFGDRKIVLTSQFNLFEKVKEHCENKLIHDNTRYFVVCGKQDIRYSMSEGMYTCMKKLGYDITTVVKDGKHDFEYWDNIIKDAIDWFERN